MCHHGACLLATEYLGGFKIISSHMTQHTCFQILMYKYYKNRGVMIIVFIIIVGGNMFFNIYNGL